MSLNWEGYNDITSDFEAYTETILMSIECLMIIILITIYVKYFYLTKNKITKCFKFLLLIALISTFMYIFGLYIPHVILSIILGIRNNRMCFIILIWGVFLMGQRAAIYLFFLIRLHDTFKGSVFEFKKQKIIIIFAVMGSVISPAAVLVLVTGYLADSPSCADGKYYNEMLLALIVGFGSDIVWAILLTYLYVKRLRQLIKMVNTDTETINDKFVYITKKLTLLALVTIISTFIQGIFLYVGVCVRSTLCLDILLNNVCVMLSFNILDKSYKKYCYCCIRIQNKCYGINENKNVTELVKEIKSDESSNTNK